MAKQYRCELCSGTFDFCDDAEWSQADAERESQSMWGKSVSEPDMAIVCDDCFNMLNRGIH